MAKKVVEQGHAIVTDESKLPEEEIKENADSLQEDEDIEPGEDIQPNEEIKEGAVWFTLKGASSFLCRGIKFESGKPMLVFDEALAARLRATGFFKEGV